MIGKQNLRSEPSDIDENVEETITVDQRLERIRQNSWPIKRLPTDSDIDEGLRKPGVPNDPDDIDNDVDDEYQPQIVSSPGSIMGDDRILSSSVQNSQRLENIISPKDKDTL